VIEVGSEFQTDVAEHSKTRFAKSVLRKVWYALSSGTPLVDKWIKWCHSDQQMTLLLY